MSELYIDEEGKSKSLPLERSKGSRPGFGFFVGFLILSLIFGGTGGFLVGYFLPTKEAKQEALNTVTDRTKTEKIILQESSAIIDVAKKVGPAPILKKEGAQVLLLPPMEKF